MALYINPENPDGPPPTWDSNVFYCQLDIVNCQNYQGVRRNDEVIAAGRWTGSELHHHTIDVHFTRNMTIVCYLCRNQPDQPDQPGQPGLHQDPRIYAFFRRTAHGDYEDDMEACVEHYRHHHLANYPENVLNGIQCPVHDCTHVGNGRNALARHLSQAHLSTHRVFHCAIFPCTGRPPTPYMPEPHMYYHANASAHLQVHHGPPTDPRLPEIEAEDARNYRRWHEVQQI